MALEQIRLAECKTFHLVGGNGYWNRERERVTALVEPERRWHEHS